MKSSENSRLSFHPTTSFVRFFSYLTHSLKSSLQQTSLDKLFPDHSTYMTDSGRSAFALTIQKLELSGKTILLPAYVCDALLPILIEYNVRPIFLDVDPDTYQPPQGAYTDQVLAETDAVLLVATYGRKPEQAVVSHLQEHNKTIIEDYAMRNPFWNDPLQGTARIYSLPKTLPVPDGGLAVLPRGAPIIELQRHRLSLTFLKNVCKLIPLGASLVYRMRNALSRPTDSASWNGITSSSNLTKVILSEYGKHTVAARIGKDYTYCYPLRVKDQEQAIQKLRQQGISAEKIWHRPIICHPEAQKRFNIDQNNYPHTMKAASEVVCAPLWHIESQALYDTYVAKLQEILADVLCQ